jgi:hypothetical protein
MQQEKNIKSSDVTEMSSVSNVVKVAQSNQKWLGVTRDVVNVGSAGAGVGFNIAKQSTKFGFGIATGVLDGLSWAGDSLMGRNPLSMVLSGVSGIVSAAEKITDLSLETSRAITSASLDTTSDALSACGAKDGELLKAMGVESQTVDALVFVTKLLSNFGDGLKLHPNILYDLGLIASLQSLAEFNVSPSENVINENERKEITRYLLYALSAYGKTFCNFLGVYPDTSQSIAIAEDENMDNETTVELRFISQMCKIEAADIVMHKTETSAYDPSYFVVLDRRNRAVVVTFRGTISIQDALTDLVCDHEPYEVFGTKGFMHTGFRKAAKTLANQLEPLIQQNFAKLDNQGPISLILTGHSLGAAVATSLTVHWMNSRTFGETNIQCYAYASPCVFSLPLATHPSLQSSIKSVVVKDDLVPRLCHGSAWDLRGRVLKVQELRENSPAEYKNLENMVSGENKMPKESAASIYKLLDPVDEPKERLYPAGTVYYATPSNEKGKYEIVTQYSRNTQQTHEIRNSPPKKYDIRYLPTELLSNMLLSGAMLSDHMPQAYAKLI